MDGSWLTGSWLLDIHFDVVLTGLAPEGHMLDAGILPHREQRLAAVGTAVPCLPVDGLYHESHVPFSSLVPHDVPVLWELPFFCHLF